MRPLLVVNLKILQLKLSSELKMIPFPVTLTLTIRLIRDIISLSTDTNIVILSRRMATLQVLQINLSRIHRLRVPTQVTWTTSKHVKFRLTPAQLPPSRQFPPSALESYRASEWLVNRDTDRLKRSVNSNSNSLSNSLLQPRQLSPLYKVSL